MKSELKYIAFNRDKSINELFFYTSIWKSEFEFIKIELSFLKLLIKTYPFKSKIPNMFEHLQLFILNIDKLEEDRNLILENIELHRNQLSKKLKRNDLKHDDFNILTYDNLADEIFNYLESYKNLKSKIYQYINGLIAE